MSRDILLQIKYAVLAGRVRFTYKALCEMHADDLEKDDIIEAIVNATSVHKKIISRRRGWREPLYVLFGLTRSGLIIYTKGRFHREAGVDILYILISSKKGVCS